MKKRVKGSQVVVRKKRRSELQATTALRVESSYPVRRAHQRQTKARDGSARYHTITHFTNLFHSLTLHYIFTGG